MSRNQGIHNLLRVALITRNRIHDRSDAGFAMIALMIVLMIAISGSVALAMRGGSGLLASALTSQRREARETAEAALVAVVGELNKEPNRRMLVSGLSMSTWAAASTTANAYLMNPCLQTGGTVRPTTSATGLAGNAEQNLVSGDTTRRYILKSIRYSNKPRSTSASYTYTSSTPGTTTLTSSGAFNNNTNSLINLTDNGTPGTANPTDRGYVELRVEGRIYRGGNLVATASVTREFLVAPKCCNASFYGAAKTASSPHGSLGVDGRSCYSGGASSFLGVVTGLNGGGPDGSGSAGRLLDSTGSRLGSVLCVTTNATGTCNSSRDTSIDVVGTADVPVVPIAINLGAPPSYPGSPVPSPGSISLSGGSSNYLRANSGNTAIERCTSPTVSASNAVTAVSGCTNATYCTKLVNDFATYHCNMGSISLGGNSKLFIDTTNGPIAFYFNTTSGGISTGGTTGIFHRKCSSFTSSGCNTKAGASAFQDLGFYSSTTGNNFDLQGTPEGLSFFAYFSRGDITIGGNASAEGALWSNNLYLNGSFTVTAPPTGCSTIGAGGFCKLIGDTGGGSASDYIFDWVARSITQARNY